MEQFGQTAVLTRPENGDVISTQAFVQPVLRQREELSLTPTPLGAASRQRWLYIGRASQPLSPGDWVDCGEWKLAVQEACAVYWQNEILYWRAVLRPRKEAVA